MNGGRSDGSATYVAYLLRMYTVFQERERERTKLMVSTWRRRAHLFSGPDRTRDIRRDTQRTRHKRRERGIAASTLAGGRAAGSCHSDEASLSLLAAFSAD